MRRRRARGATSVMFVVGVGLVAAAVLIVAGTAQRYLQKEIIQDSSDAAALAGAVVRAKALNLIAFANLVMSALLAVYTFLEGTALGLAMYLPVGSSLCAAWQYDFCAYQPKAAAVQQSYESAAKRAANLLEQVASGERMIAQAAPALAVVEAYRAGTDVAFARNYGSGLTVTGVPGAPQPLPLTDESAGRFHGRAMEDAAFIYPMGFGILYEELTPGPNRPVGLAFAFSAAGVAIQSGGNDAPALPLRLADDWRDRRFYRAQSQLGQSGARSRERLSSVELGAPSASVEPTTATAQAEFVAFHGHEDLWHMSWRARLSLSKAFVPLPGNLREYWVH